MTFSSLGQHMLYFNKENGFKRTLEEFLTDKKTMKIWL